MKGARWIFPGLAVVGVAAVLAVVPRGAPDGSAAVRTFMEGREPFVTSDYPTVASTGTFTTAYTWEGEVGPEWDRARRTFTEEQGWRRRAEAGILGRFEVYTWDRPSPPAWLRYFWPKAKPGASSLSVKIGNGRGRKVRLGTTLIGGTRPRELSPWTIVEVEDANPPNPPRATPIDPAEYDFEVIPAPASKEETAPSLPTLSLPRP